MNLCNENIRNKNYESREITAVNTDKLTEYNFNSQNRLALVMSQ